MKNLRKSYNGGMAISIFFYVIRICGSREQNFLLGVPCFSLVAILHSRGDVVKHLQGNVFRRFFIIVFNVIIILKYSLKKIDIEESWRQELSMQVSLSQSNRTTKKEFSPLW